MKLGPIALKIRASNTRFGNLVGGAAELAIALDSTFEKEMAFVIPLAENATPNKLDSGISQKVIERFGIVVALQNDLSETQKLGLVAYDAIHDVREELFSAILGWQMVSLAERESSIIYYRGGRILDITRANLWYQFEFELWTRFLDDDGVDKIAIDYFDSIWAQYILTPNASIPYEGADFPVSTSIVDMTQFVDLKSESEKDTGEKGPYNISFSTSFDWYDFDR